MKRKCNRQMLAMPEAKMKFKRERGQHTAHSQKHLAHGLNAKEIMVLRSKLTPVSKHLLKPAYSNPAALQQPQRSSPPRCHSSPAARPHSSCRLDQEQQWCRLLQEQ